MLHVKDIMVRLDAVAKARAKARQKASGLRDLLAIVTWAAELQADVEAEVVKFFEVQQMVWLHLEENAGVEALNPIEDVTNSNSDPERYYPFVGTEDVPTTHKEEVVDPVEVITELKQEVVKTMRARVIEFRANDLTFTRAVLSADKAAFAAIKADIKRQIAEGWDVLGGMRAIIPTLRVRPGFVYVRA